MSINEKITNSVKKTIRISKFGYKIENGEYSYDYRFKKYIKFDEINELFSKKPKIKEEGESSYCYVLNSLKFNSTDEVLHHRAKLENADVPYIVYVDIDFKSKDEIDLFTKDYGNTPEHLLEELKKDNTVWVSGHSGSGIGIRILFLVFNYWAHTEKFDDYKAIYHNNYTKVLNLLNEKYNLTYYDDKEIKNYIDKSPISNMILKTHLCLDDEYKHINPDCNVIIHRDELKYKVVTSSSNSGTTLDSTKNIPDSVFEHYNDEILSNAQFGDEKFRREIYDRYKKSYLQGGMSKQLESFESFNDYINTKTYKNASPLLSYEVIDVNDEIENNTVEVTEVDYDETIVKKPMPRFSNFIYENLPSILKNITDKFDDPMDKDIILFSQITTLSSLFPDVSMLYAKNTINPNIQSIIIGKSGIGKGIIKQCKNSFSKIEEDEDRIEQQLLKTQEVNKQYNKQNSKKPNFTPKDETIPDYKKSILSADSSFASMYIKAKRNNGTGLLFAGELDSMTKNSGNDWGDWSVLLRAAHPNEEYRMERVGRDEKIKKVKIALLASGTPDQLPKYFPNKSDGTLARHLFYYADKPFDILPQNELFPDFDYDEYFIDTYSIDVDAMYNYYKGKEIRISMPKHLGEKYRDTLVKMKDILLLLDDKLSSTLVRLGASGMKICMLLTIMRKYDEVLNSSLNFMPTKLEIQELELDMVIDMLMNTLVKHTHIIYNAIPDEEKPFGEVKTYNEVDLLEELNEKFTRGEMIYLVENKLGKKISTADRIIKKLKEKKLIIPDGKFYIKTE